MIFWPIVYACVDQMIAEGKGHYLTGEKFISLTRSQLYSKLDSLDPDYLKTLEIEEKVFQSNGIYLK
jgi:hypothetical protein